MKSILVIGMGRFGRHLSEKFIALKNQVMVVDNNQKLIEELPPRYTDSSIGDCTNEGVIASLGVSDFDLCFVTIGENFESSLIITSLLKKHGAKYVQKLTVTLLPSAEILRKKADAAKSC